MGQHGSVRVCRIPPSLQDPSKRSHPFRCQLNSRVAGKHRGYAFIEFDTAVDARTAKEKLADFEFEGKRLNIEFQSRRRLPLPLPLPAAIHSSAMPCCCRERFGLEQFLLLLVVVVQQSARWRA